MQMIVDMRDLEKLIELTTAAFAQVECEETAFAMRMAYILANKRIPPEIDMATERFWLLRPGQNMKVAA